MWWELSFTKNELASRRERFLGWGKGGLEAEGEGVKKIGHCGEH